MRGRMKTYWHSLGITAESADDCYINVFVGSKNVSASLMLVEKQAKLIFLHHLQKACWVVGIHC